MRELQLWEAPTGVEEAFDDIAELAGECRFADCAHAGEPGCAVRAALDAGALEPSRLDSYRKLLRELEHLERRLDVRAQSQRRKEYRRMARSRRRVSW